MVRSENALLLYRSRKKVMLAVNALFLETKLDMINGINNFTVVRNRYRGQLQNIYRM